MNQRPSIKRNKDIIDRREYDRRNQILGTEELDSLLSDSYERRVKEGLATDDLLQQTGTDVSTINEKIVPILTELRRESDNIPEGMQPSINPDHLLNQRFDSVMKLDKVFVEAFKKKELYQSYGPRDLEPHKKDQLFKIAGQIATTEVVKFLDQPVRTRGEEVVKD